MNSRLQKRILLYALTAAALLGVLALSLLFLRLTQEPIATRRPLASPTMAPPTATCEWPCYVTPQAETPQPPTEQTSSAALPVIQCTPPPCAIGVNEVYFCPGECPGGCGTTCATYTPVACDPPACGPYESVVCPSGVCPGGCGLVCATPAAVCTPPMCAIGTNEAYHCEDVCPGGCGTTCATYTPTPGE